MVLWGHLFYTLVGTRLPPPPGFSGSNPPFQAIPQPASTLLNMTSTVQGSVLQNTNINSNLTSGPTSLPFNNLAAVTQNEDPSILWSKVLSGINCKYLVMV